MPGEEHVHPELVVTARADDFASKVLDVLNESQRVTEGAARCVGQLDKHERVRHGFERRPDRHAYDFVIERTGLDVLPGCLDQPSDPVVHELLAALVESRVFPGELWRVLWLRYHAGGREGQAQRTHNSCQHT